MMYEDFAVQSTSSAYSPVPIFFWFIFLAIYFYGAWMQYQIAQRTGPAKEAWWAFIPIMNTILLIKMANKPMWWFLLLLIPVVNMVVFMILWIRTAQASGKSGIWGFLVTIPVLHLVAMFVLAYGNRSYTYPDQVKPGSETKPRTPQQVG